MGISFKIINTEKLEFTYEILDIKTDKFGNKIKRISTSDNRLLDMIETSNAKYFKDSVDDWCFGLEKRNVVLVSDVGKFVNYKIEKNGSSTISRTISIQDTVMTPTRQNKEEYKKFILGASKSYKVQPINVDDLSNYTECFDYIHFFIYRDPIDRFLSMANFCNNVFSVGKPLNQRFKTKRDIIDNYLLLCSLTESNIDTKSGEVHFLSQSKHLLNINKVDYMVMIEDLSQFLKDRFGDKIPDGDLHKNKTSASNPLHLTKTDLTKDDINKIKLIFADDYLLYETYKDKMWKKDII